MPEKPVTLADVDTAEAATYFESIQICKLDAIERNVDRKITFNSGWKVRLAQFVGFIGLNFYFVASVVHRPQTFEFDELIFAAMRVLERDRNNPKSGLASLHFSVRSSKWFSSSL